MALAGRKLGDAKSGFDPSNDARAESFSGWEPKKLWRGRDGAAEECAFTEGFDSRADGRSLVSADFDGDGDVDLLMLNRNAPRLQLFLNEGPTGNAVKLRLRPASGNRDAEGTRLWVDGRAAQLLLARGFASTGPPELLVGVGGAGTVDVDVAWRSGTRHRFVAVPTGATTTLDEATGKVSSTPFPRRPPLPAARFPSSAAALGLPAGKPLAVPLFLPGCEPCKREAPALNRLAAAGRVAVVGLGVAATQGAADEAARALGYRFAVRPLEEWAGDALAVNGQLTFPTTLLFDAEGRLERVVTDESGLPAHNSALRR